MRRRSAWSAFLPPLALAGLIGWTIFYSEGVRGFAPFVNLEAFGLVGLGTLLCLWVAYPFSDLHRALGAAIRGGCEGGDAEAMRLAGILRCAADTSVGLGAVGSLLGMILMLASVDDVSAVPRRLAFLLAALFYGLLASELVLLPLSRRVMGQIPRGEKDGPSGRAGGRRLLIALLGAGTILTSSMMVLWALQRVLSPEHAPPILERPRGRSAGVVPAQSEEAGVAPGAFPAQTKL